MRDDRMVWVDIETTGLDPRVDRLLEVGLIVTDLNGHVISEFSAPIHNGTAVDVQNLRNMCDPFVQEMHDVSGLWTDILSPKRKTRSDFIVEAYKWLSPLLNVSEQDKQPYGPMCGSSVHFDRAFLHYHLPALESLFHYRNIDVSTVKELCRRISPDIYAGLKPEGNLHRAIPDIKYTLQEYGFYLDNFLFTQLEPAHD